MKLVTALNRAKSLGSAKTGVRFWLAQRVTAVALIPLGLWFVGAFLSLLTAPYNEAYLWFSSPWSATLTFLFLVTLLYHGFLGMQVVLEDYISHEFLRWGLLLVLRFLTVMLGGLSFISILKIFYHASSL